MESKYTHIFILTLKNGKFFSVFSTKSAKDNIILLIRHLNKHLPVNIKHI